MWYGLLLTCSIATTHTRRRRLVRLNVSYRATIEQDRALLARDAETAKALASANLKLESDAKRLQNTIEELRTAHEPSAGVSSAANTLQRALGRSWCHKAIVLLGGLIISYFHFFSL